MVKTTHNVDEDPLSSLPLELSAEFQKVLIPLKQVLELKSGGVLPLGSVLDSELILTAQGKPVANGEYQCIGIIIFRVKGKKMAYFLFKYTPPKRAIAVTGVKLGSWLMSRIKIPPASSANTSISFSLLF